MSKPCHSHSVVSGVGQSEVGSRQRQVGSSSEIRTSTNNATHHRRDIQGMRALAVLAVVLYHGGGLLPGGFIGVDMFFVISGYVITLLLARDRADHGRVDLKHFYTRRFRRLSPPLAVVVLVTLLISPLVESPLGSIQTTASTAIGAMLFCANVAIVITTGGYFDAAAESNPLLHTWSLAVEEQFYFVFPIVLILGWRLARRLGPRVGRWAPVTVIGGFSALSLALTVAPALGIDPFGYRTEEITFYSPITRSWEFGAGVLVALGEARLRIAHRTLATGLGAAALAALVWCSVTFDGSTVHPGAATLLPVAASVVLLVSSADPGTPVARLLGSRPLHWMGDISYSWYLWHWPLIVFTTLLVTDDPVALVAVGFASILPAMASYRYVEQPLRHGRGLARRSTPRLVATTLGVPILAALALGGATRAGFWNDDVSGMQQGLLPDHAAATRGCTSALLGPVWTDPNCTWNTDFTGEWVYLIGDSHADHFSEALIAATAATGRPLRIATTNGCPITSLPMLRADWPSAYTNGCRAANRDLPAWLEEQQAGIVVIANSNSYWQAANHAFAPRNPVLEAEALTADTNEKMELYRTGTIDLVERLQGAGHQVVLVHTVPYWATDPPWDPRRCSLSEIASDDCSRRATVASTYDQYPLARAALAGAAAASGAVLVEPRDLLCLDAVCTTSRDGVALYRDTTHLSAVASASVAALFTEVLATPDK